MAVIDVKEGWSGTGGGESSPDGLQFSANTIRTFSVTVDSSPITDLEVRGTSGLPQIREPHPFNLYLRASDIKVTRPYYLMFRVDVTYTAAISTSSGYDNPLDLPADISWQSANSEEPIEFDINGELIATVNDEVFVPPITRPYSDLVMTVVKNQPDFDPLEALAYRYAINSDTFLGLFAPGTARIDQRDAQFINDPDLRYAKVTTQIHFRPAPADLPGEPQHAWSRRVANKGVLIKAQKTKDTALDPSDPSTYKIVHAKDENGHYVTKPIMLDDDGLPADPGTTTHIFFPIYPSLPFADLPIF